MGIKLGELNVWIAGVGAKQKILDGARCCAQFPVCSHTLYTRPCGTMMVYVVCITTVVSISRQVGASSQQTSEGGH